MLNEKHRFTINSDIVDLAFIKSNNIQAFPCGRRRSTSYSADDSRIPFDPEARLNTEANNRKHSGMNGFTQTYIERWDDRAVLSLAGYLFTITLFDVIGNNNEIVKTYKDLNTFCNQIVGLIGNTDSIYANILINNNTQLFAGTYANAGLAYYTDILDSWTSEDLKDKSALDLYISDSSMKSDVELDNYYFSGLSFSAKPVATLYKGNTDFKTRDEYTDSKKRVVSLHILDKIGDDWKVHEPARLPHIEHGSNVDSVVMNDVQVNKLDANSAEINLITVQFDENANKEISVDSTKISNSGVYTKYLQTEELIADSLNVGNDIRADGTISAKKLNADETVTAPIISAGEALYQNVDGVTMKVPVIDLKQNGDFWQLQISRVGKKIN